MDKSRLNMGKMFLLLVIACVLVTGCGETTKGEHIGFITGTKEGGGFILTMAVMVSSNNSGGVSHSYCVESRKLYERLKIFSENRTMLKIRFHEDYIMSPFRCIGRPNEIIDSVEEIK